MGKYLKLFNTHTEYEAFIGGEAVEQYGELIKPNVSHCILENEVHYNPITFYVYHSSDCTVEKFIIPQNQAFDLTSLVKEGYFYGGYFSEYGGAVNYDIDNPQEGKIEGDYSYDGSSLKTEANVRFWTKADAYTENGSILMPKDNSTYFIKEVPKDYYLHQYDITVFNTNTNEIEQLYSHISNVDDAFYSDISYRIITQSSSSDYVKLSIGVSFKHNTITYTSESLFGRRGYVGRSSSINRDELPSYNSIFVFDNRLTTLDGVEVHSYRKVYTNDWTNDNIVAEFSFTMPTLN